jgi:hypothetical protein
VTKNLAPFHDFLPITSAVRPMENRGFRPIWRYQRPSYVLRMRTIKPNKFITLLGISAIGLSFLVTGCDRTVSEQDSTKVKSDGTVETKEKKTVEHPDGTVTKEEKKSTEKP